MQLRKSEAVSTKTWLKWPILDTAKIVACSKKINTMSSSIHFPQATQITWDNFLDVTCLPVHPCFRRLRGDRGEQDFGARDRGWEGRCVGVRSIHPGFGSKLLDFRIFRSAVAVYFLADRVTGYNTHLLCIYFTDNEVPNLNINSFHLVHEIFKFPGCHL